MPEDDRRVIHKQTKCLACFSKSFDTSHMYNAGDTGFGCNSCPSKKIPSAYSTSNDLLHILFSCSIYYIRLDCAEDTVMDEKLRGADGRRGRETLRHRIDRTG